jgi:hypothetical protein
MKSKITTQKEIFEVEPNGKYLVVAYDKRLNVIEGIDAESIKEAREFAKTFFDKFNASIVEIALIKEIYQSKNFPE